MTPFSTRLVYTGLQAVDSWMSKLEVTELRVQLGELFSKYADVSMEHCRRNFKSVVPIPSITQAMTICQILEGLIPKVRPA